MLEVSPEIIATMKARLAQEKATIKVNVHNYFEAKALTKEWNRDCVHPDVNIAFYQHETRAYIASASWDALKFEHTLTEIIYHDQ